MKNIFRASFAMTFLACLPVTANAERLNAQQLIAYAMEKNVCGDEGVGSAVYEDETSNRVRVTCGKPGGASEFGAGLGGGGAAAAGGILLLVALGAGGSGGGTPATTGTN